jgi:hypothetical protein
MGEFIIQISDHRRNLIGIYGPFTWQQARERLEAVTTTSFVHEIAPLNPPDALPNF